ncbi:MAG TPA: hypothetical protein VFL55_23095 [Acetobacteraceae bacterium]|nr:hypothetical protein [Acetobacteraceae bacterium]
MITLCRFCSVAAHGAIAEEQRARAEMFVEELRGIGFSAGVRDVPSMPIVVGHDRASPGPSVLFCGQYAPASVGLLRQGSEVAPLLLFRRDSFYEDHELGWAFGIA